MKLCNRIVERTECSRYTFAPLAFRKGTHLIVGRLELNGNFNYVKKVYGKRCFGNIIGF